MRGTITKYEGKKGTTYTVSYYAGIGADGKKKYKTKRGFKKKKDAETYLAQVSKEVNTGVYTDASQEKFCDFVKRWIEYKRDFVKPQTITIYEQAIRLHINPRIGHFKLIELKPFHISELYMFLKRNSKLSNQTIRQIHNILHSVFDRALKWEVVSRNIIEAVEIPKPEKRKFTTWSLEEVQMFLNSSTAREDRFFIAFMLALSTGMREGEILALRWQDINFENGLLEVNHTIIRKDKKFVFGSPKSESGNRIITLPNDVVQALKQHKKMQNEMRLKLGRVYHPLDLVVSRYNGNFVSPTYLRACFKDLIKRVDMPNIRFHDLRHTHASILLELQVDLKTIQERLGHATIGITADTYTHVSKVVRERPARLISEAFFNTK